MGLLLPLLSTAQVFGILVADRGWIAPQAAESLGVGIALIAPAFCRSSRARTALAAVLLFLLGATQLASQLAQGEWNLPPDIPSERILEGRICGLESAASSLLLEICRARDLGAIPQPAASSAHFVFPARLLLELPRAGPEADFVGFLARGDRVRMRANVTPLTGLRNPGRPDPSRRWRRRGIAARLRLTNPPLLVRIDEGGRWLRSPRGMLGASLESARRKLSRQLRFRAVDSREIGSDRGSPGGGLLAALAVGDRSGLKASDREAFARAGIAHVLAISGLHLALAAGMAFGFLRRLLAWGLGDRGRDLRVAALLGACGLATAYAGMAGFGVSVQRALIFVWAILIGLTSRRRIPSSHLLALASGLILLRSPHALFDPGTQLSFAATAGLLLSKPPLAGSSDPMGPLAILSAHVRHLIHRSAVAIAVTAPCLAGHGMATSAFGLIFNLLAVPWLSFLLLPAALLGALFSSLDGAAAARLLELMRYVGDYSLWVVSGLVEFLPASPPRGRPADWALGFGILVGVLACRLKGEVVVVLFALLSVLWLRLAPLSEIFPGPPRLVVFDVGQGDSILLQGDRSTILIDGGRAVPGRIDLGRSVVAKALAELGVRELTVVVATHSDVDHRGGLHWILQNFRASELWLPWGGRKDPSFNDLVELAQSRSVTIREVGLGSASEQVGEFGIDFLWPAARGPGDSSNDRSLVLRIEVAMSRLLMTGDIGFEVEEKLLKRGFDLSAEVLKVAHHGSGGSSAAEFIEAVQPGVVLVSAGCGGRLKLPHPDTLARLGGKRVELAWTGRDGAIFVGFPGPPASEKIEIRRWAEPRVCRLSE